MRFIHAAQNRPKPLAKAQIINIKNESSFILLKISVTMFCLIHVGIYVWCHSTSEVLCSVMAGVCLMINVCLTYIQYMSVLCAHTCVDAKDTKT